MIEMRAEERKIALRQAHVTINGSRNPQIARYLSVHMKFVLFGVSHAEAEELIAYYQGLCPLYGTLAVCTDVKLDWSTAP
jgi:uncharacterized OsmC-like protein